MSDSSIRDIADKANAKNQDRVIEATRFVEEQHIRKALGPEVWEELKAAIRKECTHISNSCPLKFSIENKGFNDLRIINLEDGRTASFNYNLDIPFITRDGPEGRDRFAFKVDHESMSLRLVDNKRNVPADISLLITDILHALTR